VSATISTLEWQAPSLWNGWLGLALGISLIVHAVPVATTFISSEAPQRIHQEKLDIILVNARSARKPTDAQALAQANLDGGGTTDDKRRAKTPLPPTTQQAKGNDLEQMQRRVQELEATQRRMMNQARSTQTVNDGTTASEQPTPPSTVSGADLLERSREMARLEAEISKHTEEYNQRPRKLFVGARTEAYALAAYLDAWRLKIERIGKLNYPEEARGKLYGSVSVYVELNIEDGSIINAEISRSSGHKVIDRAAMRILRMSGPFGPIPREPMKGHTVLSFSRALIFTQDDAFNTAIVPR
jgi:protein TonB